MTRIGLNINLGDLGDRYEEAKASAIRANADMHLLMTVPQGGVNGAGEINEVRAWADAMPDHTQLVWRTYSALEGDWVKMLGYDSIDAMWRDGSIQFRDRCRAWADALAARWASEGLLHIIRDDPANEPGLDANNRALNERYVVRCVALQEACDRHGVKVAIGAFSVGMPHDEMIEQGVYDPLLKIVKYLSVHEYPTGAIGAGDLFEYEAMLDPGSVWERLPQRVWDVDARYWLLRRCDRLYLRAVELGNPDAKVIVTETNTSEDIPDAHWVTQQLRGKYAIAECGGDLRGHQAWLNYDAEVFGTTHLGEIVTRKARYMAEYVFNVPHIIGVCFFTLGFGWGRGQRGRYRCHNHLGHDGDYFRASGLPGINAYLENNSEDTKPMEPVWNPDLFDYDVSVTDGYWNLRAVMSTDSDDDIVGRLTTEPQRMKLSEETKPANGYDWYKFQQGDKTGYFANTDKLVRKRVEDAEPPADDEPDDTPEPDTDAIDALQERVDALEGTLQSIMETLGGIGDIQKTDTVDLQLGFTVEVAKILRVPLGMTMVGLGKTLVSAGYRMQGIEPPHADMTASFVADAVYKTDDDNDETVEDFFANATPAPDATETTVTDVPDEDCEDSEDGNGQEAA